MTSAADRQLLISESSLREALDHARWGADADSILNGLEDRGEIEEIDE